MRTDIRDIFDYYYDDTIELQDAPKISPENIYQLTSIKFGKDNSVMGKSNKKLYTGLIAAAVCVLMTVTAFAAVYFLTPTDVASELGETKLAEVFATDQNTVFDIAPQESNGYSIDVLGIASGKDLGTYAETEEDKTYIVGSIARTDGEALTDYTGLTISPLVSEYEPWKVNIFTLTGGIKQSFLKDGVEYFIVESNNITIFADHTVYMAAYEGLAPNTDIFAYNADGNISFAEEYEGVKALIALPLDTSLANHEAVEELLGVEEDVADESITEDLTVEQTTDESGDVFIKINPAD